MSEREGSEGPSHVVDEAVREAVGRLLEVDSKGDVVAEVVCRSKRRKEAVERDGTVVCNDTQVDPRGMKVCGGTVVSSAWV